MKYEPKDLFLLSRAIEAKQSYAEAISNIREKEPSVAWGFQLSKLDTFLVTRSDCLIVDQMLVDYFPTPLESQADFTPTYARKNYRILSTDPRDWNIAFEIVGYLYHNLNLNTERQGKS